MVTTKPAETQKQLRIDDRWKLSLIGCLFFWRNYREIGEKALYWRIKGALMGRGKGRRIHGLLRLRTNHEKAKP